MPPLKLDINDAGELAEMLTFLREWLTTEPRLPALLAERIGHPAYGASSCATTWTASSSCSAATTASA